MQRQLQQELPHNAVAAEYLGVPLQLLQPTVANSGTAIYET